MVKLPQRHLDEEFAYSVDQLHQLGVSESKTKPVYHAMAAILRKLVLDRRLAQQVSMNYTIPLLVLVPEPRAGNPRCGASLPVPEQVMAYAPEISERTHPFGLKGYFHAVYTLEEFLQRTQVVLPHPIAFQGRPINSRELIKLMAEHVGGVHLRTEVKDQVGERGIKAETLFMINSNVTIFGQEALYQQFSSVACRIWRCLAPLKDEVQRALDRPQV